MHKIKRIVNFILPVKACNFKCHYCYVGQENSFDGEIGMLNYTPEQIQRALTVERLGGICHFSVCGMGETLLAPYAVDLVRRILENGHIVAIVTNGTIRQRIEELCALPESLRQRLFFKFSYHYLELIRLHLLEIFFKNVRFVRDKGCAFTVEITANDKAAGKIAALKRKCEMELGAACHVIESRNNLDGYSRLSELPLDIHQTTWGQLDSPMFSFQQTQWMIKRKEFCYAGDWVMNLYVESGWFTPCFAGGNQIQNVFESPEEPIHFTAIGEHCPWTHCFAAHVLLTAGVIPDLETPYYTEFRDRVCADGSHWLTPCIKEFFSTKLWQANEEYTPLKKRYINALLSLEYPGTGVTDVQGREALGKELAEHLRSKGIFSLGIWGIGEKNNWLSELLNGTSVKIKFAVDLRFQEQSPNWLQKIKHRYKYTLKTLLYIRKRPILLNRYDRYPYVDAVIVLENSQFSHVPPKAGKWILSLAEIADETICS